MRRVASDEYDIAVYASDVVLIDEKSQVPEAERVEVGFPSAEVGEKGRVRMRIFE